MDGLFSATKSKYGDNDKGFNKGIPYQEWVQKQWPKVYNGGIRRRKLTFYETESEQINVGETIERVEIKNDTLIEKHKRVYIELYEKRWAENESYIKSGILKDDNSIFYLVGDYTQWYLFAKEHLQWLYEKDPPFLYHVKTTTSIGFCIPVKNAKDICLDYKDFNKQHY